jgi:hypothetical protein
VSGDFRGWVSDIHAPVPFARLVVPPPIPVTDWVRDFNGMRKVSGLGDGADANVIG